jgi:plastocyanin
MEETLFYAFGIALVASALVLSALGLRSKSFPGSRIVLAGLVVYFAGLVGATSTFAVLNAREEQRVRDAEHAEEAATAPAEQAETTTPGTTKPPGEPPGGPARGGGQTVKVSSPAGGDLVFEPSELTAEAGSLTIEYENPSPVQHSVAIEAGSETLAESKIGTETTLTASADLDPGEYVLYCTVSGHREAGMEGTLTVE